MDLVEDWSYSLTTIALYENDCFLLVVKATALFVFGNQQFVFLYRKERWNKSISSTTSQPDIKKTVFQRVSLRKLRNDECELSAYRYLENMLEKPWHVVVIGDKPPEKLHQLFVNALSGGTATIIDPKVLAALMERRHQEIQQGDWRECMIFLPHHRPVYITS